MLKCAIINLFMDPTFIGTTAYKGWTVWILYNGPKSLNMQQYSLATCWLVILIWNAYIHNPDMTRLQQQQHSNTFKCFPVSQNSKSGLSPLDSADEGQIREKNIPNEQSWKWGLSAFYEPLQRVRHVFKLHRLEKRILCKLYTCMSVCGTSLKLAK